MSKNRRKKSYSSFPAAGEDLSARMVAIPKPEAPEALEPEPKVEPALSFQEPEPEPEPEQAPEPVVILQSPPPEIEIRTPPPSPKPEPKGAKPKPKSGRIGEMLRAARLERNDDLYLIAEYLCIKPAFLIALENSRYDEFPADAYIIGFLRTYANFLGMDGKEAVDRYRYEMAGRRKKPVLSMPTPVSEGRAPSGIIMVAAAITLLLIYALWYGISSANRAEVHVPPPLPTATRPTSSAPSADSSAAAGLTAPVAPNASVSPVLAPMASVTATPVSAAPAKSTGIGLLQTAVVIPPAPPGIIVTADKPESRPAKDDKSEADDNKQKAFSDPAAPSRIVIRATQSSWVMVTDKTGKTIFDHVMKSGEIYKVPNQPGLSMTTGNGSGIALSLDGKNLPKEADDAPHMVRNIALDPERLAAEFAGSNR